MEDSVPSQLEADVPLGSFLSGGLDSATVTGFAQQARRRSGEAIRSFTVRFASPDFDESGRARAIARDLGTRHTEVDGQQVRFDRPFLDRFIGALGEPFGDTSALAVYLLCLAARPHVKVALSGDGGDEIFLGYTDIWKQQWARRSGIVPRRLRQLVRTATRGRRSSALRRLHKYAHLSLLDGPGVIIDWSRRWDWQMLGGLLADEVFTQLFPDPEEPFPEVRAIIGDGRRGGFLEQYSRFHMLVDLPCDNLQKVDRMSMAHGLEVRVPLLSNDLLEYAGHLPLPLWKRGRRTKEPLRTLSETLAPTLAGPAPKHGFSFPIDAWLRNDLARHWRAWELTARLAGIGFIPTEIDRLVEEYSGAASGQDSYRTGTLAVRLFDLMLVALWVERHGIRS